MSTKIFVNQPRILRFRLAEAQVPKALEQQDRVRIIGDGLSVTVHQEKGLMINFCKSTWSIPGRSRKYIGRQEEITYAMNIHVQCAMPDPGAEYTVEAEIRYEPVAGYLEKILIVEILSFERREALTPTFEPELEEVTQLQCV